MHNLSRIFLRKHSKQCNVDQTPSPSSKRRLQRRNAVKNFEFNPSGSSSTSSTSTNGSSAHRTRSLDGGMEMTSFRINGHPGEVDSMLQSLGVSVADFEIPSADWELMNNRSSSDVTLQAKKCHFYFDDDKQPEQKPQKQEQEVLEFVETKPHRFGNSNNNQSKLNGDGNGYSSPGPVAVKVGGIKGDRPPLLTRPPVMSLTVLDDGCSNWDLVKRFAPEEDGVSRFPHHDTTAISDEEEKEDGGDDGDDIGIRDEEGANEGRNGVTVITSGSCSFTSNNDDDSSSTTTEPVSIISPTSGCRLNITHWEKGKLLGRGSFGSVYEGISSEGFFFAVKEVSLLEQGSQGKQSIYQLEQEIELLSQFEHENIVRYLGTDKDNGNLYIFLELATQGSISDLYRQYHLRDSHVSAYTRQILLGLKYLHDRNVVHRDIKCGNILVASTGAVKLADFGLAKATRLNDLKSCKGTVFWMAPEVVNHKNQGYGLAADIWSLGCTVLEMITGHVPYHPYEFMHALFRIGKGEPPPIPDTLSRDARDFIQQCLCVNPNGRPTAAELLDHAFVRRVLDPPLGSESPMTRSR